MSRPGRSRLSPSALLAAPLAALFVAAPSASARQPTSPAPSQPGPAPAAGPDHDAARAHRDQGVRYFDVKEYGKAITEFRLAYQIDPQPELLYAIGQSERLADRCDAAILSYEAYLRSGPNPERARLTEQHIESCRARTRPPAEPPRAAGPSRASVTRPGADHDAGHHRRSWLHDWVGHALVAGGVALAAGGGSLWYLGHRDIASARDAGTYGDFSQRADEVDSARMRERAGSALVAVGAATVALGVLHYALAGAPADDAPTAAAAVTVSPARGGAIAAWQTRF